MLRKRFGDFAGPIFNSLCEEEEQKTSGNGNVREKEMGNAFGALESDEDEDMLLGVRGQRSSKTIFKAPVFAPISFAPIALEERSKKKPLFAPATFVPSSKPVVAAISAFQMKPATFQMRPATFQMRPATFQMSASSTNASAQELEIDDDL